MVKKWHENKSWKEGRRLEKYVDTKNDQNRTEQNIIKLERKSKKWLERVWKKIGENLKRAELNLKGSEHMILE